MNIRGRVTNGVVVLEPGPVLPEGAIVTISYPETAPPAANGRKQRVRLPLVPSDRPGSIALTAERVAELLDEADTDVSA